MRKFFAAILAIVCVVCTAFAFGCVAQSEPNYYTVTFSNTQVGVRIKFDDVVYEDGDSPEEFISGAQVKEGVEISFEVQTGSEIVNPDEIVVKANDDVLTKNEDGKYSVTVNSDIVITVEAGTQKTVRFINGTLTSENANPYDRITYLDERGNELPEEYVTSASEVKFSVKVSSYYKLLDGRRDISVTASTQLLEKTDGYYTLPLTGDTTVEVQGYEQDDSFVERREGEGTAASPFILRKPIDLYMVAGIVNTDFYRGRYGAAYYEMAEDIDLEGEQLYIIGDGVLSVAYFSGSFDGKGHTISNFYIDDTIVDQESYQLLELVEIGMFGHVRPSMFDGQISVPVIKNLNLADYTINIDKSGNASFHVGTIAGNLQGGSILNCTVNGELNVSTAFNSNYVGYVGGLVGVVMSFYSPNVLRAESVIAGCTSNAVIECVSGNMYAAGGMTGLLSGNEEKTPSYIVDCVNNGSITGAFRTGGIAGMVSTYSTVKNSLSTADVMARCDLQRRPGIQEYMLYAYAGGITGYQECESIIYGCAASGRASVSSVNGAAYEKSGEIAGELGSANVDYVETRDALLVNNRFVNSVTEGLVGAMNWNSDNWSWDGSALNVEVTVSDRDTISSSEYNVTINYLIDGADAYLSEEFGSYGSMAVYYLNENIDEYVSADADNRSYGYYFDEELTQKVLPSFVVTSDITLYAGFADYSEVAGKYYLQLEPAGSGAYLEFNADGTVLYRNGGARYESIYVYDGTDVLMTYHPLFTETETEGTGEQATTTEVPYSGRGAVVDGVLTMYNNHTYTPENGLVALLENDSFAYGVYYTSENTEYTFNKDGTGTKASAQFSYTIEGNVLTLNFESGTDEFGVLTDGVPTRIGTNDLTAYDNFRGTWEAKFTDHRTYTFDGKGGWTYERYGYTGGANSAKTVLDTQSGTYTLSGETLTLSNGATVSVHEGALSIGGVEYYKQSSFTGHWRYFARRAANVVDIEFGGIGYDGYGIAVARLGSSATRHELNYISITEDGVEYAVLYSGATQVALFSFSINDNTLNGWVDGLGNYSGGNIKLCLYDDYSGTWENTEQNLTVTFNGEGLYNNLTGSNIMVVSGSATVNGDRVDYRLNNATSDGTFTHNGTVYNISYNHDTDTITVSVEGGSTFTLTRRVSD